MATFTRSVLFTPFTPVFNASGQPGISLPLFHGEDGLPLGVRIVGRPAGEGHCLDSPRSWNTRVHGPTDEPPWQRASWTENLRWSRARPASAAV